MNAQVKTEKLLRVFLPVSQIESNELNPNKMSDKEFNMLCDNIERVGITDPILVRKLGDDRYRAVGGHHRLEVAKLYDMAEVPCTVIDDPEFDEDQEKFQLVRMNVIRGRLSPEKFLKLYESMEAKYAAEVMADSFGFVDQEEFDRLVKKLAKDLPKEMQADFKEAAKEIKTIDGLAKLLNKMFSQHGDSLPYGYMIVDFGGKESVWLRMEGKTRSALMALGDVCKNERRTMDDLLGGLIRMAAQGKLDEQLAKLVKDSAEVDTSQVEGLPTLEALEAAA